LHRFTGENKENPFVEFIQQSGDYRSISIRNENLKDLGFENDYEEEDTKKQKLAIRSKYKMRRNTNMSSVNASVRSDFKQHNSISLKIHESSIVTNMEENTKKLKTKGKENNPHRINTIQQVASPKK
jgi:hypothetical protein